MLPLVNPIIIFSDLPPQTFVGINLASFNSSSSFRGIANLPPGLHLLYTGTDATLAIRNGYWLNTTIPPPSAFSERKKPPIYVLRWDPQLEALQPIDAATTPSDTQYDSIVNRFLERSESSGSSSGLIDYTALRQATLRLQSEQSSLESRNHPRNVHNRHSTEADDDDDDDGYCDDDNENEHEHDLWPALISHVSTETISRILSSSSSSSKVHPQWWIGSLCSISSAAIDTERIPGLSNDEVNSIIHPSLSSPWSSASRKDVTNANAITVPTTTMLNVLPINLKQTWPSSAVGRERTEKARDRSWYLSYLLDELAAPSSSSSSSSSSASPSPSSFDATTSTTTSTNSRTQTLNTNGKAQIRAQAARELLGELQFVFVSVLLLANYSCLEQWKRILTVLLTCSAATDEVEGFFVETVKTFRGQLERVDDVEGGLFDLADETGSAWLRALLKRFKREADDDETSRGDSVQKKEVNEKEGRQEEAKGGRLRQELEGLEVWLRETYGWDVDDGNILRRGMIQLEDGEMVEMEMDGVDEDEETGEYAPTVVEL